MEDALDALEARVGTIEELMLADTLEPRVTALETRVAQAVAALEERLAQSEASAGTGLESRILSVEQRLEDDAQVVINQVSEELGHMDARLQANFETLGERLATLEQGPSAPPAEITERSDALEVRVSALEQRPSAPTPDGSGNGAADAAATATSVSLQQLRQDFEDRLVSATEQLKDQSHLADMQLASSFQKELTELRAEVLETQAPAATASLVQGSAEGGAMVSGSKLETQVKLALEGLTAYEGKLRNCALAVDNMYTRSVTWRIRGFRNKLHALITKSGPDDVRSLWSPGFSVCAQPEMALELQMPGPDLTPTPPLPGGAGVLVPLAGSCSVRVWAMPGMHMVFRLTLGEGPSATSKGFEHTFQPSTVMDPSSRVCFQVANFCQLDSIWDQSANTIAATFELLEMRRTAPEEPGPIALGLEHDLLGSTVSAPRINAGPDDSDSDAVPKKKPLPTIDDITPTYLCTSEALVFERVKHEVQVLRNRSVRRAEWRIQGVSRLLEACRIGEAVDSPPFSAVGLDKLQLHFYPKGCDRDPSAGNSQPCALYVSAPPRVSMKATLCVGSHQRHFEHRFARRGDVGGRSKFCSLEHQIDCDDAVVVAIDISEVETSIPDAPFGLCLRAAPGKGVHGEPAERPVQGGKGSVRMKRGDPSCTEEMHRCVSLPTLHAQKFHLPQVGGRSMSTMSRSLSRSR